MHLSSKLCLLSVLIAARPLIVDNVAVAQDVPNAIYYQWVSPARTATRVQYRTFESAAVGSPVSYHIYTPEIYDSATTQRFPVVYWLHGSGGGGPGLPLLAARLDSAIRAGKIPPMLVVFPNGLLLGMWVDWKSGRVPMETVVIKELIPHIDATFRTIPTREGRLIEGFSMGGYGAARLAFKYPHLFAAVSLLAPGPVQEELTAASSNRTTPEQTRMVLDTIYGGDQEYFKAQSPWQLAERNVDAVRRLRIRHVIGDSDNTLQTSRDFHDRLTRLNIPHDFILLPGVPHNPRRVFDALGERHLEFYREAFGPSRGGARQSMIPQFEAARCPFEADASVLEQVRCGYVTVLENRSKPSGRRLKLAVAVLRSLSPSPRPDPVVRIAGGPGEPAVARTPSIVRRTAGDGGELIHALRGDRDVILYDQRGVGFSDPVFCPEEAASWAATTGGGPLARRARLREVVARCGDAMRRLGFDLSQYNSAASALDLQDIRRALRYEQWNVYGHSYGSRLALVAMRNAAEGIRSVVLSGPEPPSVAIWFNLPGFTADVLSRVSASCAAQPACHAAFPDVEKTFWRTVEDLELKPWTRKGRQDTVTTTAATFAGRLNNAMRTPRGLATVPMLVHAMRVRNEVLLNALGRRADDQANQNLETAWGLYYAVQCFEEAPLNTVELKERMRLSVSVNDPRLCDGMHSFRAADAHLAPVESPLPTLIVTGEFDPGTHRSNGPNVQRTLENSQLVEVPGAGHAGMFAHECTRRLMRDFLNAPLQKRDTSCLQAIPRLQFITDLK
jgi:pimeloyl-ACP methyl ester carboxylesterase